MLMVSQTDLDVDTTVRECGGMAGAHKSCFHSLASSSKVVLRTQKGSQYTELCESSITFDGIEAENFILRKERK